MTNPDLEHQARREGACTLQWDRRQGRHRTARELAATAASAFREWLAEATAGWDDRFRLAYTTAYVAAENAALRVQHDQGVARG